MEHVRPAGKDSATWKGDAIGAQAAHDRVVAARGGAKRFLCAAHAPAAVVAYDWSLLLDRATHCEVSSHQHYSLNLEAYVPLCRSCHKRTDTAYQPPEDQPTLPLPGFDLEAHRIRFDPSALAERTTR